MVMLSPGCRCCLSKATFSSGARGCTGNIPYAVASFTRQSDQKPFGTLTADANGVFNGPVRFSPSTTNLIVKIGGPAGALGARFGSYSQALQFKNGSTTFLNTPTIPPATNYYCLPAPCYMPMPATLHMSDPVYGAVVPLQYGVIQSGITSVMGWRGNLVINYNFTATGCRAVTTTIRYAVWASGGNNTAGSWAVSFVANLAGCPAAYSGDWSTTPSGVSVIGGTWSLQSCSPLAGKITITNGGVLYNNQGVVLTVSE